MLRFAVLASLMALGSACRISLEDGPADPPTDAPVSASCLEAQSHSDLAWIEDKVFRQSCIFSGCHNGANTSAGRIDLRTGMSHAHLVSFPSIIDPSRMLVVPSQPNQSYLLMMIKHIAPADMSPAASPPPTEIGFMPQNAGDAVVCVEKRDAIQRWIVAGALNN